MIVAGPVLTDQTPAACAFLERELLRQRPTPGHSKHIDLLVAQYIEQVAQDAGEPAQPIGSGCAR